ncbi:MAG: hypothetical protein JXR21_02105 [Candidatus Marinimicrobia bacterium]|nr:hypothetical protein [Candidatus Neomarinimicrobiota bacterium]
MNKEIVSIDSKQTAKILAITTTLISLIFSLIGVVVLIWGSFGKSLYAQTVGVTYILLPLFNFILVYLFSRLTFWIYNKTAAKYGGIMMDLRDPEDTEDTPGN